ncbi:MAG: chromosome partitioning protein [Solirubrobacterales bacterium]|nr:chromosome partitioning protein [Solirubrobacterales bacterium]
MADLDWKPNGYFASGSESELEAEPAAESQAEPADAESQAEPAEPESPAEVVDVAPQAEPVAADEAPPAVEPEPALEAPAAPEPEPADKATAPPVNQLVPDEEDAERISVTQALAPLRDPARPRTGDPVAAAAEPQERRAEVISFANQKGGVAKTTTTLNLAVAFAESGHDVLVVDLDPQGNLTMSQGIDPDKVERSMYDVLVHHIPIRDIIQKREIDIAVASIDLAGAEIAMSAQIGRERSLEKAFKAIEDDYDFICIDTPPSLGLLTVNALTASDKVIVPVQCEYLSMRGLVQLQNTLEMIRENLNPRVRIEGILPTMLDSRTVHAKEAVEILEENFGELVFKSRIKKAIKFAEAPVRGASVLKYDPKGNAAGYYRELAQEVLTNHGA